MGKGKQKFNKKQAVRFVLVPSFDENGKPITHFRPVETKKSKVNARQRQNIIRQISDEAYDQIEINGRMVGQNEIPAFVLEQIKGRGDLVFNQKHMGESSGKKQLEGDLYEVIDAKDYDDEKFIEEGEEKVWIDEEEIIDEQQYSDYDDMEEGDEEWEDDEEMEEVDVEDGQDNNVNKKGFKLNEEEFPVLNKVTIEGKQYELTEEQIKLLDVLIPENYENYNLKGLNFEKYDENGLPLSQKAKYQEFLATGNQGIVDTFDYIPDTPTPIFDSDLKPRQIRGDIKEVQDALNFEGQEGVYEELEDDFFAKLVQSEIQINKKEKKDKKSKSKKTVAKTIQIQPEQMIKAKLPKELENLASNKENNVFNKYDALDEEVLEEQITDEMLDKALDDFEHNLQPKEGVKLGKNKIELVEDEEQMQERTSKGNMSMNFSQIQKCPQFLGKDGELDWRCLTRKEKKEYMKTKIIRDFCDQMRERQIQQKLKGKKNISSEQLHLKYLIKHLTFEEDHVMRRALEEHAKEVVDLSEESSYESESDQEDINEYRQRTSVISSNLNEITEVSTRKPRKIIQDDEQRQKELDELSQTLNKLKTAAQKRDRNETKEERKQRKQKQKQLKKQKKEVKKEFSEKFNQERRKHLKMTKPADPLHKVSYVKII